MNGYGKEVFKYLGDYYFVDGNKYSGEWRDGKINGKGKIQRVIAIGVLNFVGGDKYEGDWVDYQMEGKGVFDYKDGEKYDGELKRGMRNGKGKVVKDYRNIVLF